MTETRIVVADEKETELTRMVRSLAVKAETFAIIRDDGHRDEALAFVKDIQGVRGMIGQLLDDPIDKAHKLHKSLCARRNALDNPMKDAERIPRSGIGAYEDRKRAEIEVKRQAELAEIRRQAEERERERQRLIDEARAAEEEKRLARAADLERAGQTKAAEAVIAAPIYVPPPVMAKPEPPPPVTAAYRAPAGTATRTTWKARIVDATIIPREWLVPDEQAIGAYGRSMKEKASIPGVEFYPEASATFRG